MELPSKLQINDEVNFTPMFKQCKKMGIAQEGISGNIIAIKFTEAKVFYDIYSPFWGTIFKGVTSEKVRGLSEVKMPNVAEPI